MRLELPERSFDLWKANIAVGWFDHIPAHEYGQGQQFAFDGVGNRLSKMDVGWRDG